MTIEGLEVVRNPRARRLKLTLDRVSGRARLVLPARAALKPALAWAGAQAAWLAEQRARLPQVQPFAIGLVLTIDDRPVTIVRGEGARRTLAFDGATLSVAGPIETLPRRVEAWLKRRALDLLTEETAYYAARAGVSVTRVAVGDPRGRWGSCASDGAIRYSWRLILAPRFVRRATVAHEVAHRVHMDHSPAFHALVATLYGEDPTPARHWLRTHGASLHGFGRSPV